MYQTVDETLTEKDMEGIVQGLENTTGMDINVLCDKDNTEWDLHKIYEPNHATIWNNIANIGRQCIVLQKNDKLAVVQFIEATEAEPLLPRVYRLI